MKTYIVEVFEVTIRDSFTVEAESLQEAKKMAEKEVDSWSFFGESSIYVYKDENN